MFQNYNDRLAELKATKRQRDNDLRLEGLLEQQLKQRIRERDDLSAQLAADQRDVDRLSGLSLGSLFYTLIGKKQEKLSEEETELLQTRLRYEEASDNAADLEREFASLKDRLAKNRYIEEDITSLLREKEEQIKKLRPDLAEELNELSEQETEAKADCKELREAVHAGQSVLSCLLTAIDKLDSAKNWGTYDMLGGGLIATKMKHDRIDEARDAIHSASHKLQMFERELKDVERDVHVTIDIGGMLTFGDYFFDGIFIDWIVQGRIKEAVSQVEEKHGRISRIVADLSTELRRKESDLAGYQRRQSSLVENA
ncbi:hypothetical protein ACX93W_17745 [Paenibacillus sp. CAU 1782]